MRIYRTHFEGDLLAVAPFLAWVESHIPKAQNLDEIGLALCECVHNIIEHHIQRISKKELYIKPSVYKPLPQSHASHFASLLTSSRTHSTRRNNTSYLLHKSYIACMLVIKPTQILMTFTFPFKPCYKMRKTPMMRVLGGRGERIIKFCLAQTRIRVYYGLSKGIVTLYMPLLRKETH